MLGFGYFRATNRILSSLAKLFAAFFVGTYLVCIYSTLFGGAIYMDEFPRNKRASLVRGNGRDKREVIFAERGLYISFR